MSYYPPGDATRDEILAWRNDRVREHNAAVEMVDANFRAARVPLRTAITTALRIVPAAGEQPAHVVPLAPPPDPAIVELCDCGGCEDCRGRRRVAIERRARVANKAVRP